MGMIVDIRKFHTDMWTNELYDASLIRRKWWGKRIDNYWIYLGNTMQYVDCALDSHIMADFFVYVYEKCAFEEILSEFIAKIASNRGTFVSKLVIEDKISLLNILSSPHFMNDFKLFLKELNGELYSYEDDAINDTIDNFKTALQLIDDENGLLINIG